MIRESAPLVFQPVQNIRILAWFNFCCDLRLYAPVAILYYAQVAGSYTLGSAILAIAMCAGAILELPTGVFSDRVGRKKTVVTGAVSSVVAIVLYAVAPSFGLLAVGAILEGLSRALYSGNNEALLYETLPADAHAAEFGEHLGRVSAMFQIASAVSAVAGSAIAGVSFRLVMWVSVIPQIACLILAFRLRDPPPAGHAPGTWFQHLREALRNFFSNRRLKLLSFASILGFALGEAGYQFRAAFVATLWPIWAIGLARVVSGLGAAFSFHFSGRLIRRLSEAGWLIVATVYGAVVELLAIIFSNIFSPVLMSTSSLFFGVATVSKNALMQREFSERHRATMGSLHSLAGSAVFAAAVLGIGALADRFGPARALMSAALAALPVALLYLPILPPSVNRR